MNKLEWKSNDIIDYELKERISNHKEGQTSDGYITIAEGEFIYKNISYLIKVLRYFNHTNKFTPIFTDKISDSHVVVEYPVKTKKVVDFVSDFRSEYLYHDTLHTWNNNQSIEEQIDTCHKLAKEDISWLVDGGFNNLLDAEIHKLFSMKCDLKKFEGYNKI